MVSANKWIESILLLFSCSIIAWTKTDYLSFLIICFCFFGSLTNDCSQIVLKHSRKHSSFSLWYGGFVVPTILSFNMIDDDQVLVNVWKIASIIFFLFCANLDKITKLGSLILLSIFMYLNNQITLQCVGINVSIFAIFIICFVGCTNSFSVGEALTISQLITYFIFNSISLLFQNPPQNLVVICSFVGFVTCLIHLIVIFSFTLYEINNSICCFLSIIFVVTLSLAMFVFSQIINEVLNFFVSFFSENQPIRLYLIIYWVCLVTICLIYAIRRISSIKASTAERKVFHVFILLVYIPGLFFDIPLLFFSSTLVFCSFVFISIICAYELKPLVIYLLPILNIFTDKQDMGLFILTPIYLVLGLSYPIWIFFIKNPYVIGGINSKLPLVCFSGILSVGLGDACASVVGSKYGFIKIPGTTKTVEGALSSIAIQLFAIFCLDFFCVVQVFYVNVFFAVCIISIIESCTDEIDNLVLPLLMFMLLY